MIDNPRFPHSVVIERVADSNDYWGAASEPIIIYNGECRYYIKRHASLSSDVLTSDCILSIPLQQLVILKGDKIMVNAKGVVISGVVEDFYPSNLGLNVYFKVVSN